MNLSTRHQISGYIGRGIRWEQKEGFWGAGIIPFLVFSAGYKDIFSLWNNSKCTHMTSSF